MLSGSGVTPELPDALRALRTQSNIIVVRITQFLGDTFDCTPTDSLPTGELADIISDDDPTQSAVGQVNSMTAIVQQVDSRLAQVLVGGGVQPELPLVQALVNMREKANMISFRITQFLGDNFMCMPPTGP